MLQRGNTVLRPPRAKDREFLFALRNDVALQAALLATPRANSERRVDEWVEGVLSDPASLFFLVADAADGNAVGFVQIRNIHPVHGWGELGIAVVEAARGRGHGGAAIGLIEGHARDALDLRKVVLHVRADNAAACRLYERCGYRRVGVLESHFYGGGRRHDVAVMEHLLTGGGA